MIYLDNSATTYPKPQGVRQAVQRSFIEQGANPGRSGYGCLLYTSCRGDGALLVGEGVICNEAPDAEAEAACQALGKSLA